MSQGMAEPSTASSCRALPDQPSRAQCRGDAAKALQLGFEYDPQPPFDSGSPEKADPALVKTMRERLAPMLDTRRKANQAAAAKLA